MILQNFNLYISDNLQFLIEFYTFLSKFKNNPKVHIKIKSVNFVNINKTRDIFIIDSGSSSNI